MQIVSAFEAEHYEIALNYLWGKTISALKKELATVGVGLLAEMLGRSDVDDEDDVDDVLTSRDAIRLAEELGIVNSTDALRLRHTHELITHFSQLEFDQGDFESIDPMEAITALRACVKGVLGRPKVAVAKKFVEFRYALEGETMTISDPRVEMIKGSPYFFCKLTINVVLNAARKNIGANLEHTLANINVLVPALWPSLRDAERWQIGHSYAEAYSDGKTTVVGGLKGALLKVKGFDYVPENLRSETFVRAADALLKVHENTNNFYHEPAQVKHLTRLGTTIPTPAVPACMTALICVVLGNKYGRSWAAQADASNLLKRLTIDRWAYYLNNVLISDIRVLSKLSDEKPRRNWIELLSSVEISETELKSKSVSELIRSTKTSNIIKIERATTKMLNEYYGGGFR